MVVELLRKKLIKKHLIDLFNKIIKVGTENDFFNCNELVINPISTVDNKYEYDAFIEAIKNNKIKIFFLNNDISKKQIKKDIFDNIDER